MTYCIASVSWGKDSLAMLHQLIARKYQLDEVVFYDTGAEFDCIYHERDTMLPILANKGIKYTELKPKEPFFYQMFAHPVHKRGTGEVHKYGYGWCGGSCRMKQCSNCKHCTIRGYKPNTVCTVSFFCEVLQAHCGSKTDCPEWKQGDPWKRERGYYDT